MRRSSEKILTTHIGSLPDFVVLDPAASDHDAKLASVVGDAIKRQREVGLVIINEGEFTKHGDWLRYAEGRLTGCEPRQVSSTVFTQGRDREEFAAFYKYATERGPLAGRIVLRLHRADHLSRAGRDAARDRHVPRCARRASAAGCVPHHDRASEPRTLPQERVLQER